MADIKGFKGLIYNKKKVQLSDVVAPPYDVINEEMQELLYDRNPYNIVRLILGKTYSSDNEVNSRYTRAAKDFNEFISNNILIESDKPSIFVYTQKYEFKDTSITRTGFICLLRIEDFSRGVVFPHENTLSKPKKDRLSLMKECKANFSPIFGLFSEPECSVDALLQKAAKGCEADYLYLDNDSVEHKLWIVDDNNIIDAIAKGLKDRKIFIADGHHRYETALNYKKEQLRSKQGPVTGEESFNFVLSYLTNMDNEGLSVFPIHRLVKHINDFSIDQALSKLSEYFEIEEIGCRDNDLSSKVDVKNRLIERLGQDKDKTRFGLYAGKGVFYVITLKSRENISVFFGKDKPGDWIKLDVAVLHNLLFDKILNIKEKNFEEKEQINYKKDADTAIKEVDNGNYQLAVFLNATPINMIKSICESNHRMPQKSTFFYPKLLSGLVINKL